MAICLLTVLISKYEDMTRIPESDDEIAKCCICKVFSASSLVIKGIVNGDLCGTFLDTKYSEAITQKNEFCITDYFNTGRL